MSNADIDRQVTDHLAYLISNGEAAETIGEIADQLAVSVNRVRPSIKRLASYGEVRQAGVAANGAKTWTLTSAPLPAAEHQARLAVEPKETPHCPVVNDQCPGDDRGTICSKPCRPEVIA